MRIAVTTPNGHVGYHLTRMLVRAGVRPLLLMRRPEQLSDDVHEHVDVARADSWDQEQIVAATRGVDAIYWVDPTSFADDPFADYARATSSLVAAVERNGIARVVFQSSVGAEKRHGAGEIDGLAATEVALDQLDIDVAHLCPRTAALDHLHDSDDSIDLGPRGICQIALMARKGNRPRVLV